MSDEAAAQPVRRRVRHVNPNPLFAQWLREWRDEAAQNGSHAKTTYAKALQSLAKFPLPLASGKDCIILKHFGQKICDMLDKKLAEHRKLHPGWKPQSAEVPSTNDSAGDMGTRNHKEGPSSGKQRPARNEGSTASVNGHDNTEISAPSTSSSAMNSKKKHASLASLQIKSKSRQAQAAARTQNQLHIDPVGPSHSTRPDTDSGENCSSVGGVSLAQIPATDPVDVACLPKKSTPEKQRRKSPRKDSPQTMRSVEPEVIDLSMDDSPERKRESDDDSFLMPLSKRLALAKREPRKLSEEIEAHLPKMNSRGSDLIEVANIIMNDDDDDDNVNMDGDGKGNCSVIEERLASLKKLLSPVLVKVGTNGVVSEPLRVTGAYVVEPIENALSQGDSFCPAGNGMPQESVLDISAEVRQKRLSFLAHLEDNSQAIKPRYQTAIPDLHESPPLSPKDHEILSISSNSASCESAQINKTEQSTEGLFGDRETTEKREVVISISPEPASASKAKHVPVHTVSDSDDEDLPCLAMRVNPQTAQHINVTPPVEVDSFAALVEDIATPPVERVKQIQPNGPGNGVDSATGNGAGHTLKVSRKKKAKACEVDVNGDALTATSEDIQPKKKGRVKKDKTGGPQNCTPPAPICLQYVPEGSRRIDTLATTNKTSQCPLSITMLPGTFEVVLCVDSCEAAGGVMSKKKEAMIEALRSSGVPMDIRKMNIGDFAWVARRASDKHELVLDCIVERKRADDLASSIKDGRYREQKHRLVTSGIRRKIYLVEEYTRFVAGGISDHALLQAQLNTQIVNDFIIKRTRNVKDSASYLAEVTRALTRRYENRVLTSCLRDEIGQISEDHLMSWTEFNESSMKRRKVCTKQAFTRALMVMKGMSLEKALCIVAVYPTIVSLLVAYEHCDSLSQKETLLADLKCALSGRRLGPALSKAVYRFISGEELT